MPQIFGSHSEEKHKRWCSSKKNLRAARLRIADNLPDQPKIGAQRPKQSAEVSCFIIAPGSISTDLEDAATFVGFTDRTRGAAGQANEPNVTASPRDLTRKHQGVLTDSAEVRRKPVDDIKQRRAAVLGGTNFLRRRCHTHVSGMHFALNCLGGATVRQSQE